MKTKSLNKKLSLNKKTLADLDKQDLRFVQAGIDPNTVYCTPPGICAETDPCFTAPPCKYTDTCNC